MKALLAIWAESKIQQELEIAKRNKKIFEEKKFLVNYWSLTSKGTGNNAGPK